MLFIPIFHHLFDYHFFLRLITNYQSNCPSIVMGISGKPEKLINEDVAKQHNLEIVRRFSGGGTVVVDNGTYFCTIILNKVFSSNLNSIVSNHNSFCFRLICLESHSPITWWIGQESSIRTSLTDWTQISNSSWNRMITLLMIRNVLVMLSVFLFVEKRWLLVAFSNTRMIHHTSFLYEFDKELMKALKVWMVFDDCEWIQ